MSGWTISDKNDENAFVIPDNTVIQRNGFLVVCRDKKKFSAFFPLVETLSEEMNFGLGSDGDCVRLFSPEEILIDQVCYENGPPWPSRANGQGSTLSLLDALSNNEHFANWKASNNQGTPGKPNDIVTAIDEIIKDTKTPWIYPNPISNSATIEYYADQAMGLSISIMDLSGRKFVWMENRQLSMGQNQIELDISEIQKGPTSGIYILLLESEARKDFIKVMISN